MKMTFNDMNCYNPIIIGTAGHVDHGKTELCRALTGIDTDRLAEEKRRGISISLGFAPLTLPSGQEAGLVDVPGHERFIKTMVAGAWGIDLVLFLVAADQGFSPQSREHLDIISLLGIDRGLLLLSKSDLVSPEQLAQREKELRREVRGSGLSAAPLLAISAKTKSCLPELLLELEKIGNSLPLRSAQGPFRLAVDRVFSLPGFGTIAAGVVAGGRIRAGDTLELVRGQYKQKIRLRGLEIFGYTAAEAKVGQRAALNLAHLEVGEVPKGSWLAQPGLLDPGYCWDVKLQLLPQAVKLSQGQRLHLHHGAARTNARINFLDRRELAPGETCLCQLDLEQALAGLKDDRFIIRSYSPLATIGGGLILNPLAIRQRRHKDQAAATLALQAQKEPETLLLTALREKWPQSLSSLARAAGLAEDEAKAIIDKSRNIKKCGKLYLSSAEEEQLRRKLTDQLAAYHHQYPLRQGMPLEQARQLLPAAGRELFIELLDQWPRLLRENQTLALADFAPQIPPALARWVKAAEELYRQKQLAPPIWEETCRELAIPPGQRREIRLFLDRQFLVKVSPDLSFDRPAFAEAKRQLEKFLLTNGSITLGQARDIWGTSRKFALALLEYFDRIGLTVRQGEIRVRS